ncbi:hypothetical protein K431DRAFT_282355 [Polychaeton citri CBS 116435]|uniref:Uncharacterized protein n=1 Tax=Polychaeton citri CBS 116435 TaxID=1314669 RepID=A0A9P4QCW0_9PEZI|nr:hypothetical protein K431DRAFT_282355 [Polychaeton citri CBS 116435]
MLGCLVRLPLLIHVATAVFLLQPKPIIFVLSPTTVVRRIIITAGSSEYLVHP